MSQVKESGMGAVAWGALGLAGVLAAAAVVLVMWRRRRIAAEGRDEVTDLVAAEAAQRDDDREFDRIIGNLLRTDPTFADSAARLTRHDDNGPLT